MLLKMLKQLWQDECGAVVAAEYLLLGTVVAGGAMSGMVAMRDTMISEYKEYGKSVKEMRQAATTDLEPATTMAPMYPNQYAINYYTPNYYPGPVGNP